MNARETLCYERAWNIVFRTRVEQCVQNARETLCSERSERAWNIIERSENDSTFLSAKINRYLEPGPVLLLLCNSQKSESKYIYIYHCLVIC